MFPLAPAPLRLRIGGRRQGPSLLLRHRSSEVTGQRGAELRDRLALYLHFYMDMTYQEVGLVMGVSMTAARSRIHRATRRLRPNVALDEVFSDA